jgi:hypothetical protein
MRVSVTAVGVPDDQDTSWECSLRNQVRKSIAVSVMGVLALEYDRDDVLAYQERSSQINIYSMRPGTTLYQRCRVHVTVRVAPTPPAATRANSDK